MGCRGHSIVMRDRQEDEGTIGPRGGFAERNSAQDKYEHFRGYTTKLKAKTNLNANIKRKNATGVCWDKASGIPARDPENWPGRWQAAMSRQKGESFSSEPCNITCDNGVSNRRLLRLPIPVHCGQQLEAEDPGFNQG